MNFLREVDIVPPPGNPNATRAANPNATQVATPQAVSPNATQPINPKGQSNEELDRIEAEFKHLLETPITIPFRDLLKALQEQNVKVVTHFNYTDHNSYKMLIPILRTVKFLDRGSSDVYPLLIFEFVCEEKYLPALKMYPILIIGYDYEDDEIKSFLYYTTQIKVLLPKFEKALKFLEQELDADKGRDLGTPSKVIRSTNAIKVANLKKFRSNVDFLASNYEVSTREGYSSFIGRLREDKELLTTLKEAMGDNARFASDSTLTAVVNKVLESFLLSDNIKLKEAETTVPYSFLFLYSYYNTIAKLKASTKERETGFESRLFKYKEYWFFSFLSTLLEEDKAFQEFIKKGEGVKPKVFPEMWDTIFRVLMSKDAKTYGPALVSDFKGKTQKELEENFMKWYDALKVELGLKRATDRGKGKTQKSADPFGAFIEAISSYQGVWFYEYFDELFRDDPNFKKLLSALFNKTPKAYKKIWGEVFLALYEKGEDYLDDVKAVFNNDFPENLKQFVDWLKVLKGGNTAQKPQEVTPQPTKQPSEAEFDEILENYKNVWFYPYFEAKKADPEFIKMNTNFKTKVTRSFKKLWGDLFIYLYGKDDTFATELKGVFDHNFPANYNNMLNLFKDMKKADKVGAKEPEKEVKGLLENAPNLEAFVVEIMRKSEEKGKFLLEALKGLPANRLAIYEKEFADNPDLPANLISDIFATSGAQMGLAFWVNNVMLKGVSFVKGNQLPEEAEDVVKGTTAKAEDLKGLFDPKKPNPYTSLLTDAIDKLTKG